MVFSEVVETKFVDSYYHFVAGPLAELRLCYTSATSYVGGLRDRALIVQSSFFGSMSAVVTICFDAFYRSRKQWFIRFHTKPIKHSEMLEHHKIE